jgi:phosphopantetheinyl transferase (holo-ACP synthase)
VSIGNDVVDLTAPRTSGVASRTRFLDRVFTEHERDRILRAEDSDLEAWSTWAAKEAAYKVVSQLSEAPPVFIHRSYEVAWEQGPAAGGEPTAAASPSHRSGTVQCDRGCLTVCLEVEPERRFLHAVCTLSSPPPHHETRGVVDRIDREDAAWARPWSDLLEVMTAREREAVHSLPSAAVRIGARTDAARWLDVSLDRVEIVCAPGSIGRRPPRILVDGAPTIIDVSLSHDGPWIAWALSHRTGPDASAPKPPTTS